MHVDDSRDQLSIETPEHVAIRFSAAGLGSRFLALLADTLLQSACYVLLLIVALLAAYSVPASARTSAALTPTAEKWLIAGFILLNFLLYWGYFALFEFLWRGQTPGKRWLKIRVIKDSGRQITFFEALARNLIRIIDMLPSIYLVGAVTMMCNRQHQRLGDLVAGTLVVHEGGHERAEWTSGARFITAGIYSPPEPEKRQRPDGVELPADAVARLNAESLSLIDAFLARAPELDYDRRASLATRILNEQSRAMGIAAPSGISAEKVLEAIAFELRGQASLR